MYRATRSRKRALSRGRVGIDSRVSLRSIKSPLSILSIGSVGSILSIGSAGSILRIGNREEDKTNEP